MGVEPSLTPGTFARIVAGMRFLLLLLVAVASATADTNLFHSGQWRIDGATDAGPNPRSINLVADKTPVGAFSELKFYGNLGGSNFAQVFSIKGNGTFQPLLPDAPAGGVFRLASYWDCDQGFVGPLAVTDLAWKTKAGKKGQLELTGTFSNGTSLAANKVKITFFPPETNSVRVELRYNLVATRRFCVNRNNKEIQDVFRAVSMFSNFTSPTEYANDLIRYQRVTEKICFGLYGCYTKRQAICAALTNSAAGYLLVSPRSITKQRLQFAHTTNAPTNTPTLATVWSAPGSGQFKPQGYLTPTEDSTAENVEVWSNWSKIKQTYKARKKVGKFKVVLEATDPRDFNCDKLQEPATVVP